jgi:hypothetical protein
VIKPGDLIRFTWAHHQTAVGVVLSVHPPPNYHSGIDYTIEILEPDGRKFVYDVFRGGDQPEVLSEAG